MSVPPTYKWEPVTDFYKEQQAAAPVDAEAETQQKLEEIREQVKKASYERKAPIVITIYGWYLAARAAFFLLLLLAIASSPQADFTKQLVNAVERNLPYHQLRERDEQRREMLRQYGMNPDAMYNPNAAPSDDSPDARYERLREFVMVSLLILTGLTTVVAFMWWTRSWKIRWVSMFYAGAFLAKAAVSLFAGWASGIGNQMTAVQISSLVLGVVSNGFIFCYLAFWPGVEEWFKEW